MVNGRIISTAPIDRTAIDILEQVAPVEIAPSPDEMVVTNMLERAIALVCRGEGKVTSRMIDGCPTLRVIGRTGAGFDSVDIQAATANKIPVVYAPIGGFAVAEGAMALLLALTKKVVVADAIVKNGQWNKRYEILTGDMMSHTLGIIGLGRIGSHLAKLASAFDMTVLGYDPLVNEAEIPLVSLDELLGRSDFISIHTPLSEQTRGFINQDRIARMKRGAILINTARGAVVESLDVLADGLESGQLGAVGLDVFPSEPPDCRHRIFKHPNLVCAPHLLGVSELAMDRIYKSMATDMVAVLQGRQPRFCVNPEVFA